MGDGLEAVLRLLGGASLVVGLLVGIAKLLSVLVGGSGRRWELHEFTAIVKSKDAEIERLRADLASERARLQARRDEVHRLGNLVMKKDEQVLILLMELDAERRSRGKDPFRFPDEKGDPR